MIKEYTVSVPMMIELGTKKKTKYYLNMNIFRNTPGVVNNQLKRAFKEAVKDLFPEDVFYKRFTLEYKVFFPNKMKRDINNVCAIVDKFFADALVETGHAPDDNYEHLPMVTYIFGGIAKDEGHVEVTVKELLEEA